NTVKFHLKNLYSKLDVTNRAQAVVCYLTSSGNAADNYQ
ncbi:MAG TPA: LuxR C-terminal-related transcriptional regulator, partial [Rhodospirillales bacterium]|nr:LuxR C-terminal-related transcriptional regulator [Rhodospirillales bacterium]